MTINTMQEQGKVLIMKFKSMNKKNKELLKIQDCQNDIIKNMSINMAGLIGENRELKEELEKIKTYEIY